MPASYLNLLNLREKHEAFTESGKRVLSLLHVILKAAGCLLCPGIAFPAKGERTIALQEAGLPSYYRYFSMIGIFRKLFIIHNKVEGRDHFFLPLYDFSLRIFVDGKISITRSELLAAKPDIFETTSFT